MIGHLGQRVSALLDGQMDQQEAERAWAHVHGCHLCRDQVEREGWVKTRLAGLSFGSSEAPADLKGSLRQPAGAWVLTPGEAYLIPHERSRRSAGLIAIGGGAVGAAVMGVLALGVAPADAPTMDRRAPVTDLGRPTSNIAPTQTGVPTQRPSTGATPTSRISARGPR